MHWLLPSQVFVAYRRSDYIHLNELVCVYYLSPVTVGLINGDGLNGD